MTRINKTNIEFENQSSDPSTPSSSESGLFFKDDGNLYKIDSNGTVSQVGASDGGRFTEDSNSPFSQSGAGDVVFTLSDRFDIWRIWVNYENPGSNANSHDMFLKINGLTDGNYFWTDEANSRTDSANGYQFLTGAIDAGENLQFSFLMDGRWVGRQNLHYARGQTRNGDGWDARSGVHTAASSPLTNFTLSNNDAESGNYNVIAEGFDI